MADAVNLPAHVPLPELTRAFAFDVLTCEVRAGPACCDGKNRWRRRFPAAVALGNRATRVGCEQREASMILPEELQGKTWSASNHEITSDDLQRVLAAVEDGLPRATAIPGVKNNTDRRIDVATQLLKRAGLVEFAGGKWRLVVKREAVL